MTNDQKFNKAVCAAVHKVNAGETLYGISKLYNTDYQRLMKLNGITNPNSIQIGQEICIPKAINGTPVSPSAGRRFHTIVPGDTLYGISRKYNVPLSRLMACNPDIDPYNLQAGTKINIPSSSAVAAPYITPSETSTESEVEPPETPQTVTPVTQPQQTNTSDSQMQTKYTKTNMSAKTYTVKDNESLTSVLTNTGICFCSLQNENPGVNFTDDISGVTLNIPDKDVFRRSPENQPYIIRSGDTLMTISDESGICTDDLLIMNPCCNILDFSVIGTRIRL
jgi:LysM repeat protein